MPLPFAFLRLPLAVAWACAFAAGAAAASDHGAGHGAAPAPKAKADARADVKADAKGEAKADSRADAKPALRSGAAAAAKDPLDIVRERLAEKLGATKPPEAPNRNVLRVVSRASTTESAPAKLAAGHGDDGHAPAARPRARLAAAPREMKVAMADPRAAPAIPAAPMPAHWDYQGAGGPESWGAMKPEFSKCSSGTRQSPIDIRDGIKVQLDSVQFDYKPTSFRVLDNGHTVQVNVGAGNSIEVGGRRFDLLQFHFHRPSEERVNGRQFEMVAHLVHKDLEGRLAVVAVLLDRGAAQPLIQAVWNNLPLEKGEENAAQTTIDLNALLPPERSYYTYMGSLTTPPCSEGVLWMVMKTPVPVSPQQIAIFSKLYPMNARPVQASAGRLIKESN